MSITFCPSNSDWLFDEQRIIPGSMSEVFIRQVTKQLPGARVNRQPMPTGVNCMMWGTSHYRERPSRHYDTRVQVGHGIADKGNFKRLAKWYDHVIVPNNLHAQRVGTKAFVGGIPMLDPFFDGTMTVTAGKLSKSGRIRVLYAPTHGGGGIGGTGSDLPDSNRSTWWHRERVLDALDFEDIEVVMAPHPRYGKRKATHEEYAKADVIVCDLGSPLHIAVALGIPAVVPPVDAPLRGSVEEYLLPRVRRSGWDNVAEVVREAAQNGQTWEEMQASPHILAPEHRGTSAKRWADFLTDLDSAKSSP